MIKWLNISHALRLDELRNQMPHEVLGVSEEATIDQIKTAFRELIKKYHPDLSTDFMRLYYQEYSKILNSAYRELVCGKPR